MRQFVFACAVALMAAPQAMAEVIPISAISAYFNGFTTGQARFSQYNADGSVSNGTLSIHRPGRIRFEYDPPVSALVLAAGGRVAIFDDKSNVAPEQYPLRRTPLSIILDENVDLSRARMVVSHTAQGALTSIVAQDPENPEIGSIRMIFTDNPITLWQWVVTDEAGTETRVVLENLQTGMRLRSAMFSIPIELERRQ